LPRYLPLALNGTCTLDTSGNDVNLNGPASGLAGLTKIGAGTLMLTAANNYMGGTTVSGGTLVVADAGALPPGGSLTIGADGIVVLGSRTGRGRHAGRCPCCRPCSSR